MPKPLLLKKQDITNSLITISFSKRESDGDISKSKIDMNLQEWIKMTPEQQEERVKKELKENETLLKYDFL